jgi:hypothetical protein
MVLLALCQVNDDNASGRVLHIVGPDQVVSRFPTPVQPTDRPSKIRPATVTPGTAPDTSAIGTIRHHLE